MPSVRALRRLAPLMFLVLATTVACSDDDPAAPAGDPLVATWNATSLSGTGVADLIPQGMTMTLTIGSGGTFSMAITNDIAGFCVGPTSCTQTGTYSSTSTTLTIDPSDSDATTFNYTISGNTLTLTGDIDGTAVTFVFRKG